MANSARTSKGSKPTLRPHTPHGEIDGWMNGWMDRWMHGWIDAWMDGWIVSK